MSGSKTHIIWNSKTAHLYHYCGSQSYRYQSLPAFLLPNKSPNGKYNYTLKDSSKRTLEIQLREKAFYVKKITDGVNYDKTRGSPMVSFTLYPTFDKCWEVVVAKLGGWSAAQA